MNLPLTAALLANILFVDPNATATVDSTALQVFVSKVDTVVPVGEQADQHLQDILNALPQKTVENLTLEQVQLAAQAVIAQRSVNE